MIDKRLLYFYLKFILTQRFKELSKTFQTNVTTETGHSNKDTKPVAIKRWCYQNEKSKRKLFETQTLKIKTDIMSTNHEAYVNPSFDPDGDNIQKDDGGGYNNDVSVSQIRICKIFSFLSFS